MATFLNYLVLGFGYFSWTVLVDFYGNSPELAAFFRTVGAWGFGLHMGFKFMAPLKIIFQTRAAHRLFVFCTIFGAGVGAGEPLLWLYPIVFVFSGMPNILLDRLIDAHLREQERLRRSPVRREEALNRARELHEWSRKKQRDYWYYHDRGPD